MDKTKLTAAIAALIESHLGVVIKQAGFDKRETCIDVAKAIMQRIKDSGAMASEERMRDINETLFWASEAMKWEVEHQGGNVRSDLADAQKECERVLEGYSRVSEVA